MVVDEQSANAEDMEHYIPKKEETFSHSTLVMKAMVRALELGSKELRAGFLQDKRDKFGNVVRVYIDDTRKAFCESVRTCEMVMSCDLDKESEETLKKIQESLSKFKNNLINREEEDWGKYHSPMRSKLTEKGLGWSKGFLNKNKDYYQEYVEAEVKMHREIFKVLTKLTKRLDFFTSDIFEG